MLADLLDQTLYTLDELPKAIKVHFKAISAVHRVVGRLSGAYQERNWAAFDCALKRFDVAQDKARGADRVVKLHRAMLTEYTADLSRVLLARALKRR